MELDFSQRDSGADTVGGNLRAPAEGSRLRGGRSRHSPGAAPGVRAAPPSPAGLRRGFPCPNPRVARVERLRWRQPDPRRRCLPCTTHGPRGLSGPGVCTRLVGQRSAVARALGQLFGGYWGASGGACHPQGVVLPNVKCVPGCFVSLASAYTDFYFPFLAIQNHHVTPWKTF